MKFIIALAILFSTNILIAQNECPECEKIKIVGVYDFGPPPGGNWIILLLTVTEDLDSGFDPHYTDLFFLSHNGDTITKPFGPSLSLPQITTDTIPYLLELNTELSNQNFPIAFDGILVISTPTGGSCPNVTLCHINYSLLTTLTFETEFQNKTSRIYPNPVIDNIHIESDKKIKGVKLFNQSGQCIKPEHIYNPDKGIRIKFSYSGLIWVQILYDDNQIEIHQLIKI